MLGVRKVGSPNWLRFAERPFPRNEPAEEGLLRAPWPRQAPGDAPDEVYAAEEARGRNR
jgi:hypothetical protein